MYVCVRMSVCVYVCMRVCVSICVHERMYLNNTRLQERMFVSEWIMNCLDGVVVSATKTILSYTLFYLLITNNNKQIDGYKTILLKLCPPTLHPTSCLTASRRPARKPRQYGLFQSGASPLITHGFSTSLKHCFMMQYPGLAHENDEQARQLLIQTVWRSFWIHNTNIHLC